MRYIYPFNGRTKKYVFNYRCKGINILQSVQYLKVSKPTDNKQVYYQNKQSNVQIIGYPAPSVFAINITCTKYQFTIKRQNIKLFIIYNKHTVRYSKLIDIKCLSDSTYRKYTILLITSKRKGLQHFRVIMICLSLGL